MKLLICTQAVDRDDPVLGFFVRWLEEFGKSCEKIVVVCLREGAHSLPKNVEVIALPRGRIARAIALSRISYARRVDYDAVFVHMSPEFVVVAGWLWRILAKRVGLWYVHRSVSLHLRLAALLAHEIFTVNEESIRLKSTRIRYVGHGIDIVPRSHIAREGTMHIVTVGRISVSKGLLDMMEVMDILHRQGVAFTFSIAGSPAMPDDEIYLDRLKKEIAARPYVTDVRLLGPIAHSHVPALLDEADVFLSMSRTGGVDKAVLEAMMCGVPAVTTNEAFEKILPEGLFVREHDALGVARALMRARHVDMKPVAASIREHHSLTTLIPKLIARLV